MRKLESWQSAGAFRSAIKLRINQVDSVDYFSRSEKKLREAWIGMTLSNLVPMQALRLTPENSQWPDCEALLNGEVVQIEIAEVIMPGRRRQDEYRAAKASSNHFCHVDDAEFQRRRSAIPVQLAEVIKKKIEKNYPEGTSLLIYLNIGTFDWWREEIELAIEECTRAACGSFKYVWVIWSGRLYQTGQQANHNN